MTRTVCILATLWTAAASAAAQEDSGERILSYSADITVNPDASLLVRETIRVFATGEKIQHGIYRDFPTNYAAKWISRFTTTFEVRDVQLDGAPVRHEVEMRTNGVRTRIGDPDALVSPGEHVYEITYRTHHQLGHVEAADELYWNVTGNGWEFPIESAEARVRLPRAVSVSDLRMNGFTGPQGSTEQAYGWSAEPNGEIVFRTTRSLHEFEGFTISLIFPEGLVTRPSLGETLAKWAADNRGLRVGILGTALTTLYFVFAWFLVGRDPARGDIRVQSEPPKGYSPAAMRYLSRMAFDNQTFATALVSLAVKRYIEISQGDKYITVNRLREPGGDCSPEETALLNALLPKNDSITLKQTHHARIVKAIQACHDSLRNRYERRYFLTNLSYSFPGTVLAIATVALSLYFSPHQADTPVLFLGIWLTFWTFGCVLLGHAVAAAWRDALKGVGQFAGALFISAFATPFFAAEIFVTAVMFGGAAFWVLPLIILLAIINWQFYRLMKAPTKLGRAALDEIDGFRSYLEGGPKLPHSATMTTPDAAEFNTYFPYAVALGIDKEWGERFAAELSQSAAGSPRHDAYRPYWYRGDLWERRGMTGFSSAIGAVMASEISSSSTAPGKSSGGSSSGSSGGSSGGGGGGGGGGGW